MFRKLYGPLNTPWEVTPICNYNCIHCYNYWKTPKTVAREKCCCLLNGDKITDGIIASKTNTVTITGGEPLLVFNETAPVVDKLLQYDWTDSTEI